VACFSAADLDSKAWLFPRQQKEETQTSCSTISLDGFMEGLGNYETDIG
jgi:hypothetical protein